MADSEVDILAFGPHPDDVEMGCGGTLIKLQKMGYSAGIVDLTSGEYGTRGSPDTRAREAAKATQMLGIKHRENLDLGDSHLWNNDASREKVVRVIRKYKPRIILTAHWLDDHPDHVQGAYLVKDAYYMSGFKNIAPEIEHYRPRSIIYYMCRHEFVPTFIVDITDDFERKMEVIEAYSSQFYSTDSQDPETALSQPDYMDIFSVRAQYYGRMIGCKFGEPFHTKYAPPVDDPVAIWK